MQPQGIMQMQQSVLPAQQADIPTAMQAQNPVMPVQQAAGMQQAMVMQMQQPPSMTMPQSLMSVQQQPVMPPGEQSVIMHGHQPTTLQLQPHQQQQQQAGGVSTPLSNIPLSQRITTTASYSNGGTLMLDWLSTIRSVKKYVFKNFLWVTLRLCIFFLCNKC